MLLFTTEARNKISSGVDKVADCVKLTLGPAGGNAILENSFGLVISNDGFIVSGAIELEDEMENLGAKLIKQVAEKTDKSAKGGRTTAVTLAQALIKEGRKHIEAGVNAIKLKLGMELALKETIAKIKKWKITEKQIEQVATISSESKETGRLVAEVLKKVGDGVVTVEGSNNAETSHEIVKGFQFSKGYLSPYFTNNDRQECVLTNCLVLITDKKLSNGKETVDFIDKILKAGEKNLLVIAEDVADQSLATFVVNKMQGVVNVVIVKPPEWGGWRANVLQDLAQLTGTKVLSEQSGIKLNALDVKNLGFIKKVIVTRDKTTLIGGQEVEGYVKTLKFALSQEKDLVEAERLKQRIAKLGAGVAVINVGAKSEAELVYKRQKTEDGVNDAQSAKEEGVVLGGGVALAKVKLTSQNKDKDIQAGYETVSKALSIQLKQIVTNAGESGDAVLAEVLKGNETYGYDAKNNVFCDMIEAGILDSFRTTKSALENAVSIASIALTVAAAITKKEEKKV